MELVESDVGPIESSLDISGGTLDRLISKAQQSPRDIVAFAQTVEASVLRDDKVAGDCLFGLPRGGKMIEGPSVRLAEILVPAWKNVMADVQALPVGPRDTEVTSVATFIDLENIVAIRIATKRRITDKGGHRYSDDMVVMTQNANNAIAFRNVVFKGIPQALWWSIYEKARVKALGEGGTIPQKRQAMLDWFGKLGVEPAQILTRLKVAGTSDISIDELVTLKGLGNAIKEGEITVEQAFAGGAVLGAPPDDGSLNQRLEKEKNGDGGQ